VKKKRRGEERRGRMGEGEAEKKEKN